MIDNKEKWIKAFNKSDSRKFLFGYKPTKIAFLLASYFGVKNLKNKRIVDLGCGAGRNSVFLAKCGYDVHAVDFIPQAINELKQKAEKEKLKIFVYESDLTKGWPFESNFFDAAIVNLVLGSITEEGRHHFAKELHRVLNESGVAFIYEPSINDNYYGQFIDLENKRYNFISPDDNIWREVFTEETLTEPFKELFNVESVKENRPEGMMFNKYYKRSFLMAVLKKK